MPVGSDPRLGSELAGFRLVERLGRGGMGAVYRAEDVRLGRMVALKLLAPGLAENTRFRERFLRESQLAASLDHPNVVPIYAAGEVEGQLYLAMRYVEGYDLKALLAREGRLEPARALGLLGQVAEALDVAHERGLVHRDVKPGNVLIAGRSGREHCYLADFGLTKQTSSISGLTGTGELVGTVAYVSPEQIRGEAVDARADVYALGCVLYECLAGKPPFARESDVATLWAHVNEPAPRLGGELDGVLARALAKTPGERYQSCGELVGAAAAALGVQHAATPTARRLRVRWLRRRPLLLAGVVAAAVLVAAVVALAVSLRGSDGLSGIGPTSVGVIDSASGELVAEIPLGFTSPLIAAGEGSVWVVDPTGSTLTRIDPETKEIVPPARGIPTDGLPIGLAVGGGSVWIAVNQGRALAVLQIGPELGELRRTIPLQRGQAGRSLTMETVVLAVGEGAVWALEVARGEVTRIDRETRVPERLAEGLEALSLAVGGGAVWLGGWTGVTKLDPETGVVLATASVPNAASAEATPIAVRAGSVWFAANSNRRVWQLTLAGAVLDSFPLAARPTALAVDDGGMVWAASNADGSVSGLDPATEVVETTDLGTPPAGIVAEYGSVWTSPREATR